MVIPNAWLSQGVKIRLEQTRTCSDSVNAESIDCFGGSLYLLSSNNAALLVRIPRSSQEHPKSTKTTHQEAHEHPGAPQEHPGAHQEHQKALKSTQGHSGAPRSTRARSGQTAHVLFKGHKMVLRLEGPGGA